MDEEVFSLVLAAVFFTWLLTYLIMRTISKARLSARGEGEKPGSVGVGELEERMKRAVETANEPLRREIRQLRGELDELQPRRKKLEGGAISEPGLLAERREPGDEGGLT